MGNRMQAGTWQSGYCTNVHAGADLATARKNLETYAFQVRDLLGNSQPLPVGLWLAEPAARSLAESDEASRLRDWLAENRLVPFTFNGFPQGDFHQPRVKHLVYLPTWTDPRRRDYTLLLIDHLHQLLPQDLQGSISTLPLGWGEPAWTAEQFETAAKHLESIAERLHRLEQETGRYITLAIEPEPGCALDTSEDMAFFFDRYLSHPQSRDRNRRYLSVCHDVCHAAVMFETQQEFFDRLLRHDLKIGKIQVSAAIEISWSELNEEERRQGLIQLRQFAEDRYLHQTGVRNSEGRFELWEDLPQRLQGCGATMDSISDSFVNSLAQEKWRVHFHVPICESQFGYLRSTQPEILECLATLRRPGYESLFPTGHLEVETYAWTVIPEQLRKNNLAVSIADELRWLRNQIA